MIAEVKIMNKFLEQALLFDFYGELLTDHQKEIYEQFALEDLSLSEIAEMKGISITPMKPQSQLKPWPMSSEGILERSILRKS